MQPPRLSHACAVLAVGLLALAGCRPSADSSPPQVDASAINPPSSSSSSTGAAPDAAKPLRNRPLTQAEQPTTAASIHLRNMEGMIGEEERLWKVMPNEPSRCRSVSGAENLIGKFRGDLDLIQRGIDVMAKCIALKPTDPDSYVDLANQVQSLHRFKEARVDLEKARTLGAKPDVVAAVETELDWNDGLYDKAIPAIRAALASRVTTMNIARVAQLDHDLGLEDDADRLFEEAEDSIRDTSPVPVAWLAMQRGMHLTNIGKLDEAALFFRAAIDRVPNIAEREHLAEVLHMLGQDDEATKIYEAIVKDSTDPEFMGALATIYRGHGRVADADALKAKATARYGELLKKYPEAMYWHASEYFLGEGNDPKTALALLKKNLELRPNSVSYTALARAELANGDAAAAKVSIDKALAMPIKSAALFWTAARVYSKVSDDASTQSAGKSAEFAAQAKALNPLIEKMEPPLAR